MKCKTKGDDVDNEKEGVNRPNWFWQWENAVPKDFCEFILSTINWEDQKPGVIKSKDGSLVENPLKRRTEVTWAASDSPIGCILQTYLAMANVYADWNYHITSFENVQFGRYKSENEGFYDWHEDCPKVGKGIQRKLSVSLLLSDPAAFEGGKLEIENYDGQEILPKQGSLIVFPSFMRHRVSPVTSGERISAVSWMSGPAFR